MAILQVIIDENNEVLGTVVVDAPANGTGAPNTFGALPGPGQRVLQITVDDALSGLKPDALHAAIKERHLS